MNCFKNKIILVVVVLLTPVIALAYRNVAKGTDFWLAYTSGGFSGKVMVCADKPTKGTISVPTQGWTQNFTIDSNSIGTFGVNPLWYLSKDRRNMISNFGIHIVTDEPVSVFSSDDSNIGDHTLILPLVALGYKYFISTYDRGSVPNEGLYDCVYYVVAADSNTTIEITNQIKYKGAPPVQSAPYLVTLQQGQVFFVAEDGDMTGSVVRSLDTTKKIAVFAGNQGAMIDTSCRDTTSFLHPVWDELYPVDMLGNEYLVMPYKYRKNGNLFRILATEDNTIINITDSTKIILDKCQYYDSVSYEPTVIKSTKPISVTLFSRNKICSLPLSLADSLGEPTMLQLIPTDRMFAGTVFFRNLLLGFNNSKKYVTNILTRDENVGRIYLDGNQIITSFKKIAKYPGYSMAQIDLDFNLHKIESEYYFYASHYAFCANGNTYEWDGGYSFPLGAGKSYVDFSTNPSNVFCQNLPVEFIGKGPSEVKYWHWDFGDGAADTGKIVTHAYSTPGTYKVTVHVRLDKSDKDPWDIYQRDVTVVQFVKPVINAEKPVKCPGEQITLTCIGQYYSYVWNTGEMMPAIKIKKPGTYTLWVTDTNNCTDQASVTITEFNTTKPVIACLGQSSFCRGDSARLTVINSFAGYKWSNGGTGQTITVRDPDIYKVYATDSNGCATGSDGLEIIVYDVPVPHITGLASVCKNTVTEYLTKVLTDVDIKWTVLNGTILSNDDSSFVKVAWNGYGKGKVILQMRSRNYGCYGWDTLNITIDSTLKPRIIPSNKYLCKGSFVTIYADSGYSTYKWSTGDTTVSIVVNYPGKYSLSVTSDAGCKGSSDTINLKEAEIPVPYIAHPDAICIGDTIELKPDRQYLHYRWSTGDTTMSVITGSGGNFSLTVTDTTECVGSTSFYIKQSDLKLSIPLVVNFGKTKLGKTKTRRFSIKNYGKDSAEIQNINFIGNLGGVYSLTPDRAVPAKLAPADSITVMVDFTPQTEQLYPDTMAVLVSSPCTRRFIIPVIGAGSNIVLETYLQMPDTTSKIGVQNFKIPLFCRINMKDTVVTDMSYSAKIIFNKNYFQPDSISKGLLEQNYVSGNNRILIIRDSNITLTDKWMVLTEIEGMTLLGDKPPAGLIIDDFVWSDEDILNNFKNGSLTVSGVCAQTLSSIVLIPQPSVSAKLSEKSEALYINISNFQKANENYGKYTIQLFSSVGLCLYNKSFTYNITDDFQSLDFNADVSKISSGLYYLVFSGPNFKTTKSVIILR